MLMLRPAFIACLLPLSGLPLGAADTSPPEAVPAATVAELPRLTAEQVKFVAARNGAEVLFSWTFPDDYETRFAELLRNTKPDPSGRSRVGPVSIRSGQHADQTPDPTVTYWYWLKVTLKNGQTLNIGPVGTPAAQVWQPVP